MIDSGAGPRSILAQVDPSKPGPARSGNGAAGGELPPPPTSSASSAGTHPPPVPLSATLRVALAEQTARGPSVPSAGGETSPHGGLSGDRALPGAGEKAGQQKLFIGPSSPANGPAIPPPSSLPTSTTAPATLAQKLAMAVRALFGVQTSIPPSPQTLGDSQNGHYQAIPELSEGRVVVAESTARTHAKAVRPLLATLAFATRARAAWQKAARVQTPQARQVLVDEGLAWVERTVRAARGLARALPPPTSEDRALRALIRTALGAMVEAEPGQLAAMQALETVETAARALGRLYGIPMGDPLGMSGRSDVPGFWAQLSETPRSSLRYLLFFAVPLLVMGLVWLAVRS